MYCYGWVLRLGKTADICFFLILAHKRLLQKERREEKTDQRRLHKENTVWEEAEAAADDYEYQQMLKTVQAESLRMAAMNTQSSTTAKTRTRRPTLKMSCFEEYGPMEEQEEAPSKGMRETGSTTEETEA